MFDEKGGSIIKTLQYPPLELEPSFLVAAGMQKGDLNPWTKHNLYAFSSTVGGNPSTPMVLYGGVLHGTTSRDGGLFSLVP